MNKFINRKDELKSLRNEYDKQGAGLVILYGRRRLGKTSLLKEFIGNLPHCYFLADRAGEKLQIAALRTAMALSMNEPVFENMHFMNWYELFKAFDRVRAGSEKFVLIIDEFQYLCQVQPAFSSFIQKWWDENWKHQNILLILCGSVTSMMYKETLSYSAPLYGRSSVQILLSPIKYNLLPDFLPKATTQKSLVEFFSISGGVPRYMELMKDYKNYHEALNYLILGKNSLLFNEAKYLLHEEITSPNTCWSILHALGNGSTRISELGSRLSLPANQLTRYIQLLKDLYLVYREVPVLEKNPHKSKKGVYQVADPFIKLWFGCIYPYESFLEFGEKDKVMIKLTPLIQNHISFCFEELCRQFVKRNFIKFDYIKVGRQWTRNYEIDVAGVDENNNLTVIGECKWSNKKVGISIYRELLDKTVKNKLPIAISCKYLFFSKSGFTLDLINMAKIEKNIVLIDNIFA